MRFSSSNQPTHRTTIRRRSPSRILAASLLIAGLLADAASVFAANTLTYPGAAPCDTTLQACINASGVGDVIELAFDNLNNELLTVTDKSVTLKPAAGRTPKLTYLFIASDKTAVTFIVSGLAGVGQMSAFCGKSALDLTVRDNVIGGGNMGLRVYDNYSLANSAQRTINVIGNHFSIGGEGSDNAISITGSTSPFVANVVDNDIQLTTASTSAGIAIFTGGNPDSSTINRVVIDRNRVSGTDYNAGIVLYAYGGNDNTAPPVSLDASVVNNLVSGQNGNTGISGGIAVYSSGHNTTITSRIVNNTVVDGRTGIVAGIRSDLGGAAHVTVRNNIVAWNSNYGIGIDPDALTVSSHNLVFGNGGGEGDSTPGTIEADPRFVDRAVKNYQVATNSPAINAGLDAALSPTFMLDVAGKARRVGVVDIGAYELATPPSFTVTPSADAHGTISPANAQSVPVNGIATFTITPDSGYTPSVGGTCGGTLIGATFTTHPISADCTVIANFTQIPLAPTTTTLNLAPNPASVNQQITATVEVFGVSIGPQPTSAAASGPGAITGTVQISGDGVSCVATLVAGNGSCTLVYATPGMRTITAAYAGDALNAPSSATTNLVVNAIAAPGVTVSAPMLSIGTLGFLSALIALAGFGGLRRLS